jgi:hypothetical protein
MSVSDPTEVAEAVAERLRAATVAHQDAREVSGRAAKRWRALVAEAVDAGIPQGQVAEIAGISRARVHAILLREYSS